MTLNHFPAGHLLVAAPDFTHPGFTEKVFVVLTYEPLEGGLGIDLTTPLSNEDKKTIGDKRLYMLQAFVQHLPGHQSALLKGGPLFATTEPGEDEFAFMIHNDPNSPLVQPIDSSGFFHSLDILNEIFDFGMENFGGLKLGHYSSGTLAVGSMQLEQGEINIHLQTGNLRISNISLGNILALPPEQRYQAALADLKPLADITAAPASEGPT